MKQLNNIRISGHFVGLRLDFVLILLVLVLSMGGLYYNLNIKQSPDKVFYGALETALTTESVRCHVVRTSGKDSSDELIHLKLTSPQGAQATTILKQDGNVVKTNELVIKNTSFVQYAEITTKQKTAANAPLDFRSVIGTWGQAADGNQENPYRQTVLGNCTVPFAGLSRVQAEPLIAELRKNKVFVTNTSKSKLATYQGNRVRVYDVVIQPGPYITFMQKVGTLVKINDLDKINAATYVAKKPASVSMIIDGNLRQIMRIEYLGGNQKVDLSEYGEPVVLEAPKSSITAAELQNRLLRIK